MSKQQTLTGSAPPKAHLAAQKPADSPSNLGTDSENEWWCVECRCRITISPNGDAEYGHGEACQHSIKNGGASA